MVPFRPLSQHSQRSRRSFEHHPDPYEWDDERDRSIMSATFPIHPLPSMQAPFEESMLDATGETGHVPFVIPKKGVKTRQQMLCREDGASELQYNFTYNCHWRNNPKGKFHPLTKTVAQIIFGVHLLHQHLEKSVADVADILLKHVNELDSFLQRANEDLEASLKDMLFRHKCLKVPMEHVNEFDRLLEDRAYRAQLLDGNIVIERTIGRMSELLNDYLADINVFRGANQDLDMYLLGIGDEWTYRNEDIGRIYSAMCGNTGGWSQFLQSLIVKAERLGVVLMQVSSYCNEIEKRCGAASRRSMMATRTSSRNSSNSRENGRNFRQFANNKPLPTPPGEQRPFLLPSTPGSDTPPSRGTPRRGSVAKPRSQKQPDSNSNPLPAMLTPKRSYDSGLTATISNTHAAVHHTTANNHPNYYHEAWHSEEQNRQEDSPLETGRQRRMFGHRRNKSSDEKIVTSEHNNGKGQFSPQDSAYSSVSGASAMSPTAARSRSGSAMSSPGAHLGLFPSGNLNTPRGSIPSRLGATSPAPSQISRTARPSDTPYRAPSAPNGFADAPNKRPAKRSSFSSLRRLFTKKRSSGIETIVE